MAKPTNLIALPFSETLTPTSYELPEGITADDWLDAGRALGRVRGTTMWWIGDWWAYGEHNYGDRAAAVRADDWEGPAFQTCIDAGVVCRRFETKSRDLVVSFRTHRAIAPIPDDKLRLEVLAWAASPDENGKKRTRAAVEERVREVRATLAQGWTSNQLDRKRAAENGECVVANMSNDETGDRRMDEALLCWAEAEGLFVRIDRKTDWGNAFEIPDDGDRDAVVAKFTKFYLPHKTGLLTKIPSLRGKVLGCWCYPKDCHGDIIAEVVNYEAQTNGTETAKNIADHLADEDDYSLTIPQE